jgi:hypothetical protein
MKSLSGISLGGFLSTLLLLSCVPAGNIAVNNVNDSGSLQAGSFIYALPQTVIDIHVTAEEITLIPGPYEKYAEKYLGIKIIPIRAEKVWNITKVKMQRHSEADADYVYTIRGINDPDDFPGIKTLIKDSLILRAVNFSVSHVDHYLYPPKTGEIQYTDLSVKRNFEAEKDIEVSLVMPDTNYVTRSASRNAAKEKTLEQKAEEAANFLIKLKKRRFKLAAGQYEFTPEGGDMADALKELARIEKEYLSLFIGKRIVTEIQRNYPYIPESGKEADRIVLFRFSQSEGFVDAGETSGVPVVLELKAVKKTKGLEQYKMPLKTMGNELHYRIADQVDVKFIAGEQVWAEAMYPVFQYGVMVPMNLGKE